MLLILSLPIPVMLSLGVPSGELGDTTRQIVRMGYALIFKIIISGRKVVFIILSIESDSIIKLEIQSYLIKVEKLAHSQNIWLDHLLNHLLLNINILNIVRTD